MSIWDFVEEYEEIEGNPYVNDAFMGMRLIKQLHFHEGTSNEALQLLEKLRNLIEIDYAKLSSQYPMGDALQIKWELDTYMQYVEEYVHFPELFQKTIIAVGGGFSAGKSYLINSIIKEDLLPSDTTPTTSLPTYIVPDRQTTIKVVNASNTKTVVSKEIVQAISHEFVNKYGVNLASMLKRVVVHSQKMKLNNLVLLDTPGYSKDDSGKSETTTDAYIAKMALEKADSIVWVIDIEKGTIPQHDIDFLESLSTDVPVYIVFNKADKKTHKDIRQIVSVTEKNLEKSTIVCDGITAASAKFFNKHTYKTKLQKFLSMQNKKNKTVFLDQEFKKIMNRYTEELNEKLEDMRNSLGQLNTWLLMTDGVEILSELANQKRNEIRNVKCHQSKCIQFIEQCCEVIRELQVAIMNIQNEANGECVENTLKKVLLELQEYSITKGFEKKLKERVDTFFLADSGVEASSYYEEGNLARGSVTQAEKIYVGRDCYYQFQDEIEALWRNFCESCYENLQNKVQELLKKEKINVEEGMLHELKRIGDTFLENCQTHYFLSHINEEVENVLQSMEIGSEEAVIFVELLLKRELERVGQILIKDLQHFYTEAFQEGF